MTIGTSLSRVAASWDLPEPLLISEWADSYRYLSGESSRAQGKFKALPYQIEPMDAALDPAVESVVYMWASQTGKTESVNNVVGYFISHDPSPILVLQPTIDMAESWSKDRLAPMLRDTPILRGKVASPKSRDSGNTILHKNFVGGHITAVGANAPAGLSMRPVRVVLCDEIDRYPPSAGTEGDPVSLAVKRSDTWWDAVVLKTSTPTIKGVSRIEAEFGTSDQRYWHVPCPHCKHEQPLKWAQVEWPKGEPEAAAYHCARCSKAWTERERSDAIHAGKWVPHAEFKGKRGYHLNGLYSLFRHKKGYKHRLHQAAAQHSEAVHKGEETLRVWVNTFLAETWEVSGEQPEPSPLLARCEAYGPELPADVLVLVGGADVQADRIEAEITGFGQGEESWGIRTVRLIGNPEEDGVWAQLDEFFNQEFEHPCGSVLRVATAAVDSGTKPKSVYNWIRPRQARRWYAVKGSSMTAAPLVSRPRKSGIKEVALLMVGADTAKDILYSRMKITAPGPRYMHFPIGYGYDEEFFLQLTAEKLSTVYSKGFPKRVWVKTRARNEALDIRCYQLAVLEALNVNWAALAKNLAGETKAEKSKAAAPVVRNAVKGSGRRRGNWMKGWH